MPYQPSDFQVQSGQLVVRFNEAGVLDVRIEGACVKATDPDLPPFSAQDVRISPDQISAAMFNKLVLAMKKGAARRANKESQPEQEEAL